MEKRLVETWSRDVPLSSLAATAGITRRHVYSLSKKIRRWSRILFRVIEGIESWSRDVTRCCARKLALSGSEILLIIKGVALVSCWSRDVSLSNLAMAAKITKCRVFPSRRNSSQKNRMRSFSNGRLCHVTRLVGKAGHVTYLCPI